MKNRSNEIRSNEIRIRQEPPVLKHHRNIGDVRSIPRHRLQMEELHGISMPTSPNRHNAEIRLRTSGQLQRPGEPDYCMAEQPNKPKGRSRFHIISAIQSHDRLNGTIEISPHRQQERLHTVELVGGPTAHNCPEKTVPTPRD